MRAERQFYLRLLAPLEVCWRCLSGVNTANPAIGIVARRATAGLIVFVTLGFCWVPSVQAQNDVPALYKSKCAGCHAPDGSANTKAGKNTGAVDFRASDVDKESDSQLIEVVAKGRKKMPKFDEKLKKQEIVALIAYVRGFVKKA